MTINARNRTPAYVASLRPEPVRIFSQTDWRPRRLQALITRHIEDFSASREIADIAEPLAARVTALPSPLRFRRLIGRYAEAVHEFVGTVTGWVGSSDDAESRTAHLVNEPGKRQRAMTLLADLAQRPEMPEISDEMVLGGAWVEVLTAMAEPVDAPLNDLLMRAYPPGSPELCGQRSHLERLEHLLYETVDLAAVAIERNLRKVESEPPPAPLAVSDDEQKRAELKLLGVKI